jgi:cytochrome c biogenesis protein CcmG/thiol:disulfide interchange protein DsbE
MARYVVPLVFFVALVALLAVGLKLDPRRVPSPLIDKAAPEFTLPQLHETEKTFGPAELRGKVWLLNVWASWCVACRAEHEVLKALSKQDGVLLFGLNYKDERADAQAWLTKLGNPYRLSAYDRDGRVGIDYGVYGVPETFLIDGAGRIRYKHIGPVDEEDVREKLLPMIRQLSGAAS